MKINMNDTVKVKLTDHGIYIHKENHRLFYEKYGNNKISDYHPPEEDAEGYSTWQLWSLMSAFGEHIGIGLPLCFETEIKIND